MAVRRVRKDGEGSATIAATNNAPSGIAANASSSNAVLTIVEYTVVADKFNALLAACVAHGIVNSA